jgi:hypothetical protein
MNIWDIVEKNKIKTVKVQGSFTASSLSPDGLIVAFGVGNDWHRGVEAMGKL